MRELDFVARKPISHDNESMSTDSSQYMPPSMQLEHKAAAYCTFECCELRAENGVELPEQIAEYEST